MDSTGSWSPWLFLAMFIAASFLMIWVLEIIAEGGLEGTVLGTLVMPYCSGIGNLIFAYVLGRDGGDAAEVLKMCLMNNVTNMTLILGLPAVIWGMDLIPDKAGGAKKSARSKKTPHTHEVNRLSLLLTLTAVLFFTGATWALGADGKIDFTDGLVLVGVFLFWQCFHIFEVLKSNVRQNKRFSWLLPAQLALLGIGAYGVYVSTDWLVKWISQIHTGFISAGNMGWLSGILNVLPNAMLAIYYAATRRPEIVYTSQVGDSHICIPLCIGVFALFHAIVVPPIFGTGIIILLGATVAHFIFIAVFGRLPSYMGWVLIAAYGWFLYRGLLK